MLLLALAQCCCVLLLVLQVTPMLQPVPHFLLQAPLVLELELELVPEL